MPKSAKAIFCWSNILLLYILVSVTNTFTLVRIHRVVNRKSRNAQGAEGLVPVVAVLIENTSEVIAYVTCNIN